MLKLRTLLCALVFVSSFAAAPLVSAATVIHAGHLFDTAKGKVLEKQSIIIEAGRVTNVEPGFIGGDDDDIIDLSSSYVSP
ncbi:MAG: amidohydrolase family protein, partial [Proteobacteria bacterium]